MMRIAYSLLMMSLLFSGCTGRPVGFLQAPSDCKPSGNRTPVSIDLLVRVTSKSIGDQFEAHFERTAVETILIGFSPFGNVQFSVTENAEDVHVELNPLFSPQVDPTFLFMLTKLAMDSLSIPTAWNAFCGVVPDLLQEEGGAEYVLAKESFRAIFLPMQSKFLFYDTRARYIIELTFRADG